MDNLEVIFGPPGTGKTTELATLARRYVEQDGTDTVLMCAYTKTAARELASRDIGLADSQVGTLHSHCLHALDTPKIAESLDKEWNEAHPAYPISKQKALFATDDEPRRRGMALAGDECLNELSLLRHRMIPEDRWPDWIRIFARAWNGWKQDTGTIDYADMIDRARTLVPVAPGHPATIIVDEAQDLSLLQWDLLTRWGRHAERVIVSGDDDQCLYRWAGADFRPLLAAAHRRVLPTSYRVPRRVQTWANTYTDHIHQRHPKTWQPRDDQGMLMQEPGSWESPEWIVSQLQAWLEDPWDTFACIAPCSYMLAPLIAALREAGLPFGNRWRPSRRDWNPLVPPDKGISTRQRFLDFMRPADRLWTWQELATWIDILRVDGVLHRGAKAKVTLHADDAACCTMSDLETIFEPQSIEGALRSELAWLEDHVLQSKAENLAYPLRIYKRLGRAALSAEPQITVGTAHSLKGAEADTVVFWDQLSRAQEVALCEGGDDADDVYRMRYVAATRARENLYVISGLGS